MKCTNGPKEKEFNSLLVLTETGSEISKLLISDRLHLVHLLLCRVVNIVVNGYMGIPSDELFSIHRK